MLWGGVCRAASLSRKGWKLTRTESAKVHTYLLTLVVDYVIGLSPINRKTVKPAGVTIYHWMRTPDIHLSEKAIFF